MSGLTVLCIPSVVHKIPSDGPRQYPEGILNTVYTSTVWAVGARPHPRRADFIDHAWGGACDQQQRIHRQNTQFNVVSRLSSLQDVVCM